MTESARLAAQLGRAAYELQVHGYTTLPDGAPANALVGLHLRPPRKLHASAKTRRPGENREQHRARLAACNAGLTKEA